MDWYIVHKDYIQYLRQFDARVEHIEYGKRVKPHIGIILAVNGYNYYIPVSSAKPKHRKMSNNIDFHKIQDSGILYAVLNLNNMIPVPDACITQIKYNNIAQFRFFKDDKEKDDYIYLLQKEKAIIDRLQPILEKKAEKLYNKCMRYPDSTLASRCCEFRLLEEKSSLYKSN